MVQIPINPFDNDRLKTRKVQQALDGLGLLPARHADRPTALESRPAFIEKINRALGSSLKPASDKPFVRALNAALAGGGGGGGGGGSPYSAQAVTFDGSTTLYTATLSGGVPSAVGTFFHWYRCDAQTSVLSTTSNFAFNGFQPNGTYPLTGISNSQNTYIEGSGHGVVSERYVYQGNDPDFNGEFGLYADINAMDGAWQLSAFSWNTNADAGSRTFQIWQNGALRTVTAWFEDGTAFEIDWSLPVFCVGSFGWDFNGIEYVVAEPFIGDSSDMFLDIATAVDLSNPAVIAKIVSGGKPVDQGADGSLLTGSQPLIYLSGDASTYGANKGYGGTLAVAGALTDAATSPSD